MTVSLAIWCIAIGMIVAIFFVYYNRTILGGFVRTLIESGALSRDDAMTLTEAGYEKNFFVKNALKKGGMFRKIVFEIEDEIKVASEGHSFSDLEVSDGLFSLGDHCLLACDRLQITYRRF